MVEEAAKVLAAMASKKNALKLFGALKTTKTNHSVIKVNTETFNQLLHSNRTPYFSTP